MTISPTIIAIKPPPTAAGCQVFSGPPGIIELPNITKKPTPELKMPPSNSTVPTANLEVPLGVLLVANDFPIHHMAATSPLSITNTVTSRIVDSISSGGPDDYFCDAKRLTQQQTGPRLIFGYCPISSTDFSPYSIHGLKSVLRRRNLGADTNSSESTSHT